MWDIVYYLAGVGMIGTIGYGFLWVYDRDMAEDVAQQVSWNSVKAYHKANLEITKFRRWYDVNTRERISRSDDEEEIFFGKAFGDHFREGTDENTGEKLKYSGIVNYGVRQDYRTATTIPVIEKDFIKDIKDILKLYTFLFPLLCRPAGVLVSPVGAPDAFNGSTLVIN